MWRCGTLECWQSVDSLLRHKHLLWQSQAFASSYSSHARTDHLLHIAKAAKNEDIRSEALRLALDEAKLVRLFMLSSSCMHQVSYHGRT